MVQVSGYVGPQEAQDSSTTTGARQGDTGEWVVSQGKGAYSEIVQQGNVFSAAIPPGTGQAPGTAIGTTACFTLGNNLTATVRLVILTITVGYISGTLGAGVVALLAHASTSGITAPSGGTAITPTNMLLGHSALSVANCRFNNTVPAAGLMIRAICNLQASLASTAVAPWQINDRVDGGVIVGPGQAVSVQAIAAAGSSPLITVGMTWIEEEIV